MDTVQHVYRTEMSPLAFLDRAAKVYPEKEAVIYGDTRMTYAEFAAYCYRFASALTAAGLKPGDRVAILCPNTPPMLASHFAVPLAGGVLVTINTRLSSEEVASSKTSMGERLRIVRAMATRCFSPPDSFRPRSPTIVSLPSGSWRINASRCARRMAFMTSSSSASGRP